MADRKTFENSVVKLPPEGPQPALGLMVSRLAALPSDDRLTLHFSFDLPALDELEARVAAGETVSLEEQDERYAADPNAVTRLRAWLESEGFQIESVTRDGIYASAPSSQIARSLNVNMVRVTRNGFTNMAAQNAPSLPAEIGASVQDIGGLQPFIRAHRHSRARTPHAANRADRGDAVAGFAPQAADRPFEPPFLVSEIAKAYNFDGAGATGAGQVIAILIDTAPNPTDLDMFWDENQIPRANRIEIVNVRGGTLPVPEVEETLDASWASGVAPGAKIRIYATGSLAWVDLDRALDRIIADLPATPGLRQLSISLGLGEQYMSRGEIETQRRKYLRLAAAGVNIFVSSGDAGSNPDTTGHGSGGTTQAEYPSSDPSVIGVGGTSLDMGSDGTVRQESAWPSSGGGASYYFSRPAWQNGAGLPAGTMRMVPDVGLVADPNTGAFLILNGRVSQFGGTSWSAPVWAGICALINEIRLHKGKAPLPFLNPLLYPQIATSCFRDVTAGSNGHYQAKPGYDQVTGLGVPNVEALVTALT